MVTLLERCRFTDDESAYEVFYTTPDDNYSLTIQTHSNVLLWTDVKKITVCDRDKVTALSQFRLATTQSTKSLGVQLSTCAAVALNSGKKIDLDYYRRHVP